MTNRWHVLGAGAIGSLFAASLHRTGISTTLLSRNQVKQARPSEPGADICIDRDGSTERISLPVSYNDETEAISHLLVTTKAYDLQAALSQVKHRLSHNSQIVILVNGMGFMDELKSDFPNFQFTSGTTTEGAYRLSAGTGNHRGRPENHLCHAGDGLTRLGRAGIMEAPPWFSDWTGIDLPCQWETHIEACLWRKLAVNCAINPLSALHQCKNGDLSTRPDLSGLVRQLCDEIAQVSLAAGFIEASNNIHRWVKEVIASTSDNRSSMLQDILAGRRTELDYISGYFLKVAGQNGVSTPCNRAAYEGVLQLANISS